jgi:PAS domain S-box-containing protein
MSIKVRKNQEQRIFSFVPRKIFLIGLSCLLIFLSFYLAALEKKEKISQEQTRILSTSVLFVRDIEMRYRNIFSTLSRLITEPEFFKEGGLVAFEKEAQFLQQNFKEIESIAIIDTEFAVKTIYPHHYDEFPIDTNKPASLTEWLSIYEGNTLKGFVLCVIDLEQLIKPNIISFADSTMVQIGKDNETVFTSDGYTSAVKNLTISQILSLQDATYISASFAASPRIIQAIQISYYRTLLIALVFTLLTLLTVYYAQKFYAISKLNESRYRELLDDVFLVALILDPKGRISYCNDFFLSITGWQRETVIGLDFFSNFFPKEDTTSKTIFINTLGQDLVLPCFEHAIVTKEGKTRWIMFNNTSLRNTKGEIIGVASLGEDITERKHAEEKINHQFNHMQALFSIDQAITARQGIKKTLLVVLDQVTSQLKVSAAAVLLFNNYSQSLKYAAGRGFKTEEIKKTSIPLGVGLTGKAALLRDTFGSCNIQDPDSGFTRVSLAKEENFCCYHTAPLLVKGKVKGVLEVFSTTQMSHDKEWIDFFKALAQQTAIAVDNDYLFIGLKKTNSELFQAYESTIEGWSNALDLRDKETENHSLRVTEMTVRLCQAAGMSSKTLIQVRRGALLHDIGKMGIPDRILLKIEKLTVEEWEIIRKHPVYAFELLSPIEYLRPALDIPYCHHEKWDGSGYPRGLKGDQIPFSARVFAVVDVYDALLSDRPYRKGWPKEKVYDHIRSLSGTHFDPEAVKLFFQVLETQSIAED